MKKLTVEQIDNELRTLMTEQPNFQYTTEGAGCFYYRGPTNKPELCDGCIFGQAFQRLGITKETLKNDCSRDGIGDLNEPWLPDKKPDYWVCIQSAQDSGATWGSLVHLLPTPAPTTK